MSSLFQGLSVFETYWGKKFKGWFSLAHKHRHKHKNKVKWEQHPHKHKQKQEHNKNKPTHLSYAVFTGNALHISISI